MIGYEGNGSTEAPLVELFDGSTWSVASLPSSVASLPSSVASLPSSFSGLDGPFTSVVAFATNNVLAVGWYCGPSTCGTVHTLVTHCNGSTWSRVPSPDPSNYSELFGIAAMSPTSI
jgi:hypothetical protein